MAGFDGLDEQTRDPGTARNVQSPRTSVALTIIHHFDPARVGERALIAKKVQLSRAEPTFGERPLLDPFISRKPLSLSVTAKGVEIAVDPSGSELLVDGQKIADRTLIGADRLDAGVVLELGKRVVLLLSEVEVEPARGLSDLGLVGENGKMHRLRREILRVAPMDVPILLRGETGTGKELVARAIHAGGARPSGPCLAVNLAAVHPTVAASELFGHQKGAFTGAVEDAPGYFRRADGGTLFLDEVGETPVEVQVMLLRALETKTVAPVGGGAEVPVDVRLVSATDADLEGAVREGRFRKALLHRIAGYEIHIPALRERRDDIGRLLRFFIEPPTDGLDPDDPWLPAEIAGRLARHAWPGNVRQLRNIARQLVIASAEGPQEMTRILDRVLGEPAAVAPEVSSAVSPRKPGDIDDQELEKALEAAQWRLEKAATALGISRASLYRLIESHPTLKTAKDLSEAELLEGHRKADGDLDRMSVDLRVSKAGIRQRLKQLGIS